MFAQPALAPAPRDPQAAAAEPHTSCGCQSLMPYRIPATDEEAAREIDEMGASLARSGNRNGWLSRRIHRMTGALLLPSASSAWPRRSSLRLGATMLVTTSSAGTSPAVPALHAARRTRSATSTITRTCFPWAIASIRASARVRCAGREGAATTSAAERSCVSGSSTGCDDEGAAMAPRR